VAVRAEGDAFDRGELDVDLQSSTGRLSVFFGYFVFMAFAVGLFALYRYGWREHRLGFAGLSPGSAAAAGAILLILLAIAIA
jgi:hypothetical protein